MRFLTYDEAEDCSFGMYMPCDTYNSTFLESCMLKRPNIKYKIYRNMKYNYGHLTRKKN